MKGFLTALAVTAAVGAPSLALAQPSYWCARSNAASNAQGTLLGAAGGALAGSALAGGRERGLGAILGAVGGGILGNRIADARNDPCYRAPQPVGYVSYYPAPAPQVRYLAPPVYALRPISYAGGFSVPQRIRLLDARIRESANEGRIGDDQAADALRELNWIRNLDRSLTYSDGGALFAPDEQLLQGRLNRLDGQLRRERDQ